WRAKAADRRGRLAEEPAVGARERDDDLTLDGSRHAFRQRVNDRVRIAERDVQVGASHLGAVADAVYLKYAREAFAHAFDHIRDQLTREAVQRLHVAFIVAARDANDFPVDRDVDAFRNGGLEFAFGTLDLDRVVGQSNLHSIRNGYR